MTKQIKWENSLTALFMFFSVVLLIIMLIQYIYGKKYRTKLRQQLTSTQSAGFTMEEIPDYKSDDLAITSYQDIVKRPLFFKVRKPIEPKVDDTLTKVDTTPINFDFILTGIIQTPDGLYCLLQNPRAGNTSDKFKRLKQGEEIDGRTIKEIHTDRIVIAYKGSTEEKMLMKPRRKKAAVARKKTNRARKTTPRPNPFNKKTK